jgi:hypothetical protein
MFFLRSHICTIVIRNITTHKNILQQITDQDEEETSVSQSKDRNGVQSVFKDCYKNIIIKY